METTVADWITAAFTAVLAVVTLVLVIATARYVTQTRRLVKETKRSRREMRRSREQSAEDNRLMREEMAAGREESCRAREQSVLPKLAIDMETIASMFVGLKLTNVGQGPALEVELTITFEPVEGGSLPPDVRPWRAKVLARDEWLRFVPPRDEQGEPLDVPFLGRPTRGSPSRAGCMTRSAKNMQWTSASTTWRASTRRPSGRWSSSRRMRCERSCGSCAGRLTRRRGNCSRIAATGSTK